MDKQQALTTNIVHLNGCTRVVGPRGGVKVTIIEARRNGKTRTWKRDANRIEFPVKRGLREYFTIGQHDLDRFHIPEDCPLGSA
jgi:hypothetical protein